MKNRIRRTLNWLLFLTISGVSLASLFFAGWRYWAWRENRRVERWVYSYGGSVSYGETVGAATFPRTPEFLVDWFGHPVLDDILMVNIYGSPGISADEMEILADHRSLRSFCTLAITFDDTHMEVLARSRSIENLTLVHPGMTDAGLRSLAEMSQLKCLDLTGGNLTADGLAQLARLPHLDCLFLREWRGGPLDPAVLGNLDSLRCLYLYGSDLAPGGLSHLQLLPQLKVLALDELNDEQVEEMIGWETLEILSIEVAPPSETGFQRLVDSMPKLRSVTLPAGSLESAFLEQLRRQGLRVNES